MILLKPCRPDDILGAVLKVTAMLDEETAQENLLQSFRQQVQEKLLHNKVAEKEKTNILIKFASDFIKDNYFRDITLDTVAKQIFITPGYLSQLFKQETGINFLEYLNQYRIEKAKELLKNTFLKNYEISDKVGFADDKYFSQVFKRYTGLTPTQYRESATN